jgi:hypothetical protein
VTNENRRVLVQLKVEAAGPVPIGTPPIGDPADVGSPLQLQTVPAQIRNQQKRQAQVEIRRLVPPIY